MDWVCAGRIGGGGGGVLLVRDPKVDSPMIMMIIMRAINTTAMIVIGRGIAHCRRFELDFDRRG